MTEIPDALAGALAAYFEAYEADRIEDTLDGFLIPCHVVSDAEAGVTPIPWATREACRAGVQRVLDWHRQLGVAGRRVVRQTIMPLSPRMGCVDIAIAVENQAGETLYGFEAVYTLALSGGAWKVAAISHNQIPRLLARLGATGGGAQSMSRLDGAI